MDKRKENLQRLLRPRHIAFIGGRDLAGAIRNCEKLGYGGEIWAVNPKRDEIAGRPCYPSVSDLPGPPDAAFVGVRKELTVEVVRELVGLGAGGCVCYAAGFSEIGPDGEELQEQLVEAAGNMALVGPNCYGLINYLNGAALWPDLHGGERVEQGIAILSQSGNISLNLTMAERSLPISHIASIGNQAVLGLGDYVEALLEESGVRAIGMYVEGIDDVPGFSRAALRALHTGIPLVVLKSGSSEVGKRITLSHTSSLSEPDELYDALFERLGIVRADSVSSFMETLKLLATTGPLGGRKLGVLAGSGGDAALVADLAATVGIALPGFDESQDAALRQQLANFVSVSNPLDYNTGVWGDREELERCFTTVMEGDFDATLLTLDYPRPDSGDRDPWDAAVDALIATHEKTGRPAMVASTIPELLPRETRERLLESGVVPLQGLPEALAALAGAAWYGERRQEILVQDPESLVPMQSNHVPHTPQALDEWEGKRLLAASGLRVPGGQVTSQADAPATAAEIGFPVVVKAMGRNLAHKSELGAVALSLKTTEDVRAAVEKVRARVAGLPDANGTFLVERMVEGAIAELIVGLKRDERFGLALVVGSGGTLANLVKDSVTLLLPTSHEAVARALDTLKTAKLLDGFCSHSKGDREGTIDAVLAIAAFAEANLDRLVELDVNPLIVLPDGEGVVAADVFVRMEAE
jgi:acetate---CoA ligase (ADP-forming)